MTEPTLSKHFESSYASEPDRRRYAQNSLIVDAAIAISKAVESAQITQKDLAARLGKTEGYVSQVLSGGSNFTLRTLADVAYALDCMVDLVLKPIHASSAVFTTATKTAPASWKVEPAQEDRTLADTRFELAA